MSGPTIDRANSSGDIWTPQVFINAVERKFGLLDWDLAATVQNAKADLFIEQATNSLSGAWSKLPASQLIAGRRNPLLFLNPPYANIAPWARKCMEEWKLGAEILLLVPMGSQNWYWDYIEPYAQVYCVGRMVFDNCFDKQGRLVTTNYPKDLILAHFQPGKHGNRPVRWRWQDE